jgi:hypothetical protein
MVPYRFEWVLKVKLACVFVLRTPGIQEKSRNLELETRKTRVSSGFIVKNPAYKAGHTSWFS